MSMTWTCIVTTAPRSNCTLKLTCDSLADCGWTPIIFAEPGSTDISSQYETHWNSERLGIWRNWMQVARWAVERNTTHVFTVQDDVDLHPESKQWLESIVWPKDTGFISPYTPRPYQTWKDGRPRPKGLNPVKVKSCWTGQSLAFELHVISAIVNHPRARNWVGLPPKDMRNKRGRILHRERQLKQTWNIQNSDYIIGSIVQDNLHRKLYYPNPSLATHCNPVSSVNHGSNTGRRNALMIADFSIPIEGQF